MMAVAVGRSWERRLTRARQLASQNGAASSLLAIYARLLEIQHDCFDAVHRNRALLCGSLERDLPLFTADIDRMLTAITSYSVATVADAAARLQEQGALAWDPLLTGAWRVASGQPFLARMFLQPYAECLAAIGIRPQGRPARPARLSCPFCGGVPQLAILQSASGEDGGNRHLMCATCSTVWGTGRFFCANCHEQDERRLSYFHSPELDHVRVDACDSCRHYLKTVDLTRLGTAEPAVDEVAAGALDLWAVEHGFRKIELNLIGL